MQTFATLEQLKDALDDHRVTCGEFQKNCPGYAAKMVLWELKDDGYHLGVCSGTLYQGKYLITNSHCIPAGLKSPDSSCMDHIKVLFPETNRLKSQNVRCKKVIQAYEIDHDEPDLAVIELETTMSRESARVRGLAFSENENVYAFTMNPNPKDKTLGVITKKSCKVSVDNVLTMTDDLSSNKLLIYGNKCELIHGNSGSGLFNENGELIAAIHATIDRGILNNSLKKKNIIPSALVPMGFAQNIICLTSITSNLGIGCSMNEPNSFTIYNFIKRAMRASGLQSVPETQIKYEISSSMQLRLGKVSFIQEAQSLFYFKRIWEERILERSMEEYNFMEL